MIHQGRSYFVQNGSLLMTVVKIQYQNDEYVKFKGVLSGKTTGIVFETKNYKLSKEVVKYWLDFSKKVWYTK